MAVGLQASGVVQINQDADSTSALQAGTVSADGVTTTELTLTPQPGEAAIVIEAPSVMDEDTSVGISVSQTAFIESISTGFDVSGVANEDLQITTTESLTAGDLIAPAGLVIGVSASDRKIFNRELDVTVTATGGAAVASAEFTFSSALQVALDTGIIVSINGDDTTILGEITASSTSAITVTFRDIYGTAVSLDPVTTAGIITTDILQLVQVVSVVSANVYEVTAPLGLAVAPATESFVSVGAIQDSTLGVDSDVSILGDVTADGTIQNTGFCAVETSTPDTVITLGSTRVSNQMAVNRDTFGTVGDIPSTENGWTSRGEVTAFFLDSDPTISGTNYSFIDRYFDDATNNNGYQDKTVNGNTRRIVIQIGDTLRDGPVTPIFGTPAGYRFKRSGGRYIFLYVELDAANAALWNALPFGGFQNVVQRTVHFIEQEVTASGSTSTQVQVKDSTLVIDERVTIEDDIDVDGDLTVDGDTDLNGDTCIDGDVCVTGDFVIMDDEQTEEEVDGDNTGDGNPVLVVSPTAEEICATINTKIQDADFTVNEITNTTVITNNSTAVAFNVASATAGQTESITYTTASSGMHPVRGHFFALTADLSGTVLPTTRYEIADVTITDDAGGTLSIHGMTGLPAISSATSFTTFTLADENQFGVLTKIGSQISDINTVQATFDTRLAELQAALAAIDTTVQNIQNMYVTLTEALANDSGFDDSTILAAIAALEATLATQQTALATAEANLAAATTALESRVQVLENAEPVTVDGDGVTIEEINTLIDTKITNADFVVQNISQDEITNVTEINQTFNVSATEEQVCSFVDTKIQGGDFVVEEDGGGGDIFEVTQPVDDRTPAGTLFVNAPATSSTRHSQTDPAVGIARNTNYIALSVIDKKYNSDGSDPDDTSPYLSANIFDASELPNFATVQGFLDIEAGRDTLGNTYDFSITFARRFKIVNETTGVEGTFRVAAAFQTGAAMAEPTNSLPRYMYMSLVPNVGESDAERLTRILTIQSGGDNFSMYEIVEEASVNINADVNIGGVLMADTASTGFLTSVNPTSGSTLSPNTVTAIEPGFVDLDAPTGSGTPVFDDLSHKVVLPQNPMEGCWTTIFVPEANVTIQRGADAYNINNVAEDLDIDVVNSTVRLIFINPTVGWITQS